MAILGPADIPCLIPIMICVHGAFGTTKYGTRSMRCMWRWAESQSASGSGRMLTFWPPGCGLDAL